MGLYKLIYQQGVTILDIDNNSFLETTTTLNMCVLATQEGSNKNSCPDFKGLSKWHSAFIWSVLINGATHTTAEAISYYLGSSALGVPMEYNV